MLNKFLDKIRRITIQNLFSRCCIFDEIVNGILDILNEDVSTIILYGSVARGTETSDSDIDIALIIRHGLSRERRDELDGFLGDMDLKYDKVFSVVDIEEQKFETWKKVLPFYQNVSKEGIVLWKAA